MAGLSTLAHVPPLVLAAWAVHVGHAGANGGTVHIGTCPAIGIGGMGCIAVGAGSTQPRQDHSCHC